MSTICIHLIVRCQAQSDLNLRISRMFEGTFLLDVANMETALAQICAIWSEYFQFVDVFYS